MEPYPWEVITYPPPKDGLPYAVVVILEGVPQLVEFEKTMGQAEATARATHERLWRAHKFGVD